MQIKHKLLEIIAKLENHIKPKHETIATAESCTGGLLAYALTSQPGSSAYYLGGASVYSNEAKTILTGVPTSLITEHGAVSREVAEALATGIRKKLDACHSISITGIAGPSGGSPHKPVGTIWIGIDSKACGTMSTKLELSGDRDEIRYNSSIKALEYLLNQINK